MTVTPDAALSDMMDQLRRRRDELLAKTAAALATYQDLQQQAADLQTQWQALKAYIAWKAAQP